MLCNYGLKLCQEDLGWILGKISLLEKWSGVGTGCTRKQWSHCPWRCSRNVCMTVVELGWRLNLMILEGFPNQNNSVIVQNLNIVHVSNSVMTTG